MKLNLRIPRWSETFQFQSGPLNKPETEVLREKGFFYVLGQKSEKKYATIIEEHVLQYQKDAFLKSDKETIHFIGTHGPVWILRRSNKNSLKAPGTHHGAFKESLYTQMRDAAGSLVSVIKAHRLKQLSMEFFRTTGDEEQGVFVGFDLGAYQFRPLNEGQDMLEGLPQVVVKGQSRSFNAHQIKKTQALAAAINCARHLVNLPGNDLNPKSFSLLAQEYFKKISTVKVEVWESDRLAKEGMGLHLGVGKGAQHGPCMVHLSYRPKGYTVATKEIDKHKIMIKPSSKISSKSGSKSGSKSKSKSNSNSKSPVAIVGKGVTFDTGGLDLKPSAGMRWMKKDMGGAAATFALCAWAADAELQTPCDFYLGIAENAIGPNSFRPGDILKSRNGMTVEIHNTDAEGRLVLADVIDVAIKQKDKPRYLIDIATLTGAIKVALGADVPGLFCNDDALAKKLEVASQWAGENCWRMPLVPKYSSQMYSPVAHMTNAVDGFAGAITAALFLEKFVGDIAWAHLDIYAWNDKPMGGLSFMGGSGQGVQTVAQFLEDL